MNKKAIATQAIIIIGVLFFTIVITTGTLFLFNITSESKKQTIELEVDTINYGTFLLNYLRTPTTVNGTETNMAELIIYAIENDAQLIEKSMQEIKPFFWKLQISGQGLEDIIIIGDLEGPADNELKQEQIIPNYIGKLPRYYKINMIGNKIRHSK